MNLKGINKCTQLFRNAQEMQNCNCLLGPYSTSSLFNEASSKRYKIWNVNSLFLVTDWIFLLGGVSKSTFNSSPSIKVIIEINIFLSFTQINTIANKKLWTSPSFFSRLPLRFKSNKTCSLLVHFLKPHWLQLSWLEILNQERHDCAKQEFASLTKTKSKTENNLVFQSAF